MKIPRILFISHTQRIKQPYLDPSVRYRCYNFGEYMRFQGGIADVISLHEFRNELIDYYDYFIFYRPSQRVTNLAIILEKMREKNKFYHADYDDLIFAVEYALDCPYYLINKRETLEMFQDYHDTLKLFDHFTVSTEVLYKEIHKIKSNAKVEIIPNGLSYLLLRSLGLIKANHNIRTTMTSRNMISYFPGGISHDRDFAYIKDVLIKFLERRRDFYLLVGGSLNFNIKEFPRDSVIRQIHLPYRSFFKSIGQAYINIAPLLLNNRYNECRTSLKFFESGIWGVPTIASCIKDYERFSDCKGLKLAKSIAQWEEYLETLTDINNYEQSIIGLHEYCINNCLSKKSTLKILSLINQRMRV